MIVYFMYVLSKQVWVGEFAFQLTELYCLPAPEEKRLSATTSPFVQFFFFRSPAQKLNWFDDFKGFWRSDSGPELLILPYTTTGLPVVVSCAIGDRISQRESDGGYGITCLILP